MESFNFFNPTRIIFGKNKIQELGDYIKQYKNILFTYGGGSIKKNGIYEDVIKILKNENKTIVELSGIMPNPRTEKVYEGIELCKKYDIDFILAVGGGSVIDCSKAIAIGAKVSEDFWKKFYLDWEECTDGLPLGTILTLSATGTEMNAGSVITDWNTHIKTNYATDYMYSKFSILDPTYTYSLPKEQTVYGSIDILAHVFEQYFSAPDESNLSDDLSEAIIKNVIDNLEVAVNNPNDYIARSNLMWCSTMALNNIIGLGKVQDWNSHQIEHALSGIYDIPHGAGLAIIFPNWMKYVYKRAIGKFKRYAINIWNVDTNNKTDEQIALEGIEKTKEYFSKLGAPVTLKEVNIFEEDIDKITQTVILTGEGSYLVPDKKDVENILRSSL